MNSSGITSEPERSYRFHEKKIELILPPIPSYSIKSIHFLLYAKQYLEPKHKIFNQTSN
jgi:hypothetical protein